MHIHLHILGDTSIERTEWAREAAELMNVLQQDVFLAAGEPYSLPKEHRGAFGYDLGDLLAHFELNPSRDSAHIYLGSFPTKGGRATATNGAVTVASAGHLLAVRPDLPSDVVTFHLLFRTAVSMAAGNLTCDEPECLFQEPDTAWPLFTRICTRSMQALRDRSLDANQIGLAARLIGDHRDKLDVLATIERSAIERISADRLEEEIAKLESDIDVLARRFATRGVTRDSIAEWLRQIGRPSEVGPACKLLHGLVYVDWQQMVDIFNNLLKRLPRGGREYTLVPFGQLADSPQIIDYIVGHDLVPPDVEPLSTALAEIASGSRAPRLIFADDALFSGRQASWVLRQYFGQPTEGSRKPYVKKLPKRQLEALMASQVVFLCGLAHPDGVEVVKKTARDLGLRLTLRYGHMLDRAGSRAFDPGSLVFADQSERIVARNMARRIGRSLLMSGTTVRQIVDEREADKHALGWDGMEQLVVFPWSTPKLTLTLLWKQGNYGGKPWIPLFPLLTE